VSFDQFLRGEYSLVEFDLQFRGSLIEAAPGLDVVLVLLVDIFLLLFIWLTDHESGLVLEVIFSREVKLGLDDIFSSSHRLGFNLLVFIKERRRSSSRKLEIEHSFVVSGLNFFSTE
jgi:hypothetical protein